MNQAQCSTDERDLEPAPQTVPTYHFDAGGHVAMLQANLARQLRDYDSAAAATVVDPVERLVQFCSRSGGYAMLAMGYAIVGVFIVNWL